MHRVAFLMQTVLFCMLGGVDGGRPTESLLKGPVKQNPCSRIPVKQMPCERRPSNRIRGKSPYTNSSFLYAQVAFLVQTVPFCMLGGVGRGVDGVHQTKSFCKSTRQTESLIGDRRSSNGIVPVNQLFLGKCARQERSHPQSADCFPRKKHAEQAQNLFGGIEDTPRSMTRWKGR